MISLSHLLGALLKDIAQARMSSDSYSRDISRYYELDPLLRGFSVPRADIDSVEFELKFALKGAQLAKTRDMDRTERLSDLLDEYELRTADCVVGLLLSKLRIFREEVESSKTQAAASIGTPPKDPVDDTRDNKSKKLEYLMAELQQLKQDMAKKDEPAAPENVKPGEESSLELLWDKLFEWIKDEGLAHARAVVRDELKSFSSPLMKEGHQDHPEIPTLVNKLYDALESKLVAEPVLTSLQKLGVTRKVLSTRFGDTVKSELKAMLDRFHDAVNGIIQEDADCEVELLFTAEQLTSVPPAAISSLKLRTALRNYKWAEGDDETNNQTVRQLLPE